MALDVERVLDDGVHGQEALGRSGRFETLHLTLASPRRLMRILSAIVLAQALLMATRPEFVSAILARPAEGCRVGGRNPRDRLCSKLGTRRRVA